MEKISYDFFLVTCYILFVPWALLVPVWESIFHRNTFIPTFAVLTHCGIAGFITKKKKKNCQIGNQPLTNFEQFIYQVDYLVIFQLTALIISLWFIHCVCYMYSCSTWNQPLKLLCVTGTATVFTCMCVCFVGQWVGGGKESKGSMFKLPPKWFT